MPPCFLSESNTTTRVQLVHTSVGLCHISPRCSETLAKGQEKVDLKWGGGGHPAQRYQLCKTHQGFQENK